MSVVEDVTRHWYIVFSIPLVAALIGYVTKLVAIKMMFEPIEFVGVRPYLGWQGIVPRRAARMASIAVDTMTRDLISANEVVARLDPDRIAQEIAEPMRRATDRDHPRDHGRVPAGRLGRDARAGARAGDRPRAGRDAADGARGAGRHPAATSTRCSTSRTW